MKAKAKSKNQPIADLCQEAFHLYLQQTKLNAQLSTLKARMINYARRNTRHLTETDSGGKSWVFQLAKGQLIRISFPADSYPALQEEDYTPVRDLCGEDFKVLFEKAFIYVPAEKFFDLAHELLGGKEAAELIEMVRKANTPRVSFEIGAKEKA